MKVIKTVNQLRKAIAEGRRYFRICLRFGLYSRKTITLTEGGRFHIVNQFDGSEQRLSVDELFTKTNIGEAMRHGAFVAESPEEGRKISFETRHFGMLSVVTSTYRDGNALAVELVRMHGEPFTVLSVNMPERAHLLAAGEFFAKTWGENEDIAEDALDSGIFRDTGRTSGETVNAPIWAMK